MLEQWLQSCPELPLVALDIGTGKREERGGVPVNSLALRFATSTERTLIACLDYLAGGNTSYALELAQGAQSEARVMPDLYLLAGALLLAEGRIDESAEPLRNAYEAAAAGDSPAGRNAGGGAVATTSANEPLGLPARRLYPQLRLLLRVAPAQLLPLYPDSYGAALLLAVALWRNGSGAEALEVLREASAEFGLNDELRLIAGQVHLARGNTEKAIELLAEPPDQQHDALDMTRSLYLALARVQRGELREAVHALRAGVLHTKDVNPHTHARARLLLAHVYGQTGMPLEALRHSAVVAATELPQGVTVWLGEQESQWVEQLGHLDYIELEQQARADYVTLHIPSKEQVLQLNVKRVEIARDPVAGLKTTEMSWSKRREQEQQIVQLQAAAGRGEQVMLGEPQLSPEGREVKQAIARAQKWWEQRRRELRLTGDSGLMLDCGKCAQLRFDLRGNRAAPVYNLPCERLWDRINWAAGIMATIVVVLVLLRACTGGL